MAHDSNCPSNVWLTFFWIACCGARSLVGLVAELRNWIYRYTLKRTARSEWNPYDHPALGSENLSNRLPYYSFTHVGTICLWENPTVRWPALSSYQCRVGRSRLLLR